MKTLLSLLMVLMAGTAFAQTPQFQYQRPLGEIQEVWHAIDLPDAAIGKSRTDLGDFRIIGITTAGDTIQAPYVLRKLERHSKLQSINFESFNRSSRPEGNYETFALAQGENINRFKLDFRQKNYDWRVKIEGSNDEATWYNLVEAARVVSIQNQDARFEAATISFPKAAYKYYRVLTNSVDADLIGVHLDLVESQEGRYRDHRIASQSQVQAGKASIIEIDLRNESMVSHLSLDFKDQHDFYRSFELSYLADSFQTDKGWKYQYETLHRGILTSWTANAFDFDAKLAQRLQIKISNQDNEPLNLDKAAVSGYVHQLVARFDQPANYFLVYGDQNTRKPSYDLAQFQDKIPAELTNLSVGTEENVGRKLEEQHPLFENPIWLWLIMGAVILTLGWFSIKMMK